MLDVRPSPIAGTWYPGDREALRESIDRLLQSCPQEPLSDHVVGLIAPHAGHRYSGEVAAHAFRTAEGLRPQIVAVVSPLHALHPGRILTTDHEAYSTPLGDIPIARTQLEQLGRELENAGLNLVFVRNDNEHAVEIELPFLQRVLPESFQLLPLMLRDQSRTTAQSVGRALASVMEDESPLLIASTDLSHFYPHEVAVKFDREMLARMEAFDPEAVLEAEDRQVGFACGRSAVAAVLWAAEDLGADRVELLDYATSGDVSGDYSSVVGYGAAAILRSSRD
jgi:AmmeMemoRadiSam system protein B